VITRLDPPLLVKRIVWRSEPAPGSVPISTWVVQPSAGIAQSGIVSHPPSLVACSSSAIGTVAAVPDRITYAELLFEKIVSMVKKLPTTEVLKVTVTANESPEGRMAPMSGKFWEVKYPLASRLADPLIVTLV
jgi:hypothetical protein